MIKVKPKNNILFYDGQPLKDEKGKEILIRDVIVNSINLMDEKEEDYDKARVFEISLKMYQSDEVELTSDEAAFILKRAEKTLVPVAYGRLKEILN